MSTNSLKEEIFIFIKVCKKLLTISFQHYKSTIIIEAKLKKDLNLLKDINF